MNFVSDFSSFSTQNSRMPKRKYPFEDCCNHMRKLKMHIVQPSIGSMEGEASTSFNGPLSAIDTYDMKSSTSGASSTQTSIENKKIQLFVNFKGELVKTTPPTLPSPVNPPAQTRCHSCSRPDGFLVASSRRCHFCEKLACDACIQLCVNCEEEFCVLCSIKVYRPREDVTLCLSCS